MLEAVDHPVLHLKRTKLDFLDLTGLSPGAWRELTVDEVRRLKRV
jgi:23S rRNA pseudouridine2605 synthase